MSHAVAETPRVYGLLAEFVDPDDLLDAAVEVGKAGYTRAEAYTPFPVHGVSEALGFKEAKVPWIIFFGGLTGGAVGFGWQTWISAVDYPMNVGGRPMISWPHFFPVTFECTILFAAFGAVIGMLALNGLPRPHHPIFGGRNFEYATQDRFFLCIESHDPMFDPEKTREFLLGLGAASVTEVEND